MTISRIAGILIEQGCEERPLVAGILGRLPGVPVRMIPDIRALQFDPRDDPSLAGPGKNELLLMENRGRFFKKCPGTPRHICCGYMVLHHAAGCPMDCTYCVLQTYLNVPFLVQYVNIEDMLAELRGVFEENRGRILRLGTGEFTDSLALERITGFTEILLPLLREYPDVFLEVKTKTADVDAVLGMEPRGRIILAWSLNPDEIISGEEQGAASLGERLAAAHRAQEAGYPVAFHFDPMILFPGWEEAYRRTVRMLAEAVDLSRAFWISMGALRFPPALKPMIEARFPESRILYHGEFITGADGKMRYFKPTRIELFRLVLQEIRAASPEAFVYLCMERPDVWDAVFGEHPRGGDSLKSRLDGRCVSVAD